MIKKLLFFVLISCLAYGQKKPVSKFCQSDEVYQELVKKDPHLSKRMDEMNEQIRKFSIKNKNNKPSANGRMAQEQTNYTIPVIVYVVHDGGVDGNITDVQVQSQITALNTYFEDSGFNFCLATKAGNQNLLDAANVSGDSFTTPGIIHVNNASIANHNTTTSSQQALVGGTSGYGSIKKDSFLRIWVVKSINGDDTTAGYSPFPKMTPYIDGVVMNYKYFGNNASANFNLIPNYQQGKILAHEVGHYLGLRHTFEGGCHDISGSNCETKGDYVCDTPPVATANRGCPTNVNSCTEDNLADDISNYMDYTYDACKNHFTAGQKDRMLFHLLNYRSSLYNIDNLIFTGVCGSENLISSNFTGSLSSTDNSYIYNICSGSTMYFKPVSSSSSYPSGVTYLWDFGNGLTSTLENPSTTYNLSSNTFYTVTLTVTRNGNGSSSTSSKSIYVNNCSPITNKESTWYYGEKNILKFNTGVPRTNGTILFDGVGQQIAEDYRDDSFEALSMLNADDGNVIFFTDGKDVFNGLNPADKINNTMLIGSDWSPNALSILKSPLNNNQYYIIHKLAQGQNLIHLEPYEGLRYSIVNVNNGIPTMSSTINQAIVPTSMQTGFKTSSFDNAFIGAGAVEVVEKNDGGYWIITQLIKTDRKTYLGVFDFSTNGNISLKNTFELPSTYWTQTNGMLYSNQIADFMTVSPNGDKIMYSYYVAPELLILDFDKFEGIISKTTSVNPKNRNTISNHIFSPDSRLIYTIDGQEDIDTPLLTLPPNLDIKADIYTYGPDGKVYYLHSQAGSTIKLGVIHKPNEKATNFNPNAYLNQENIIQPEFVSSFINSPRFPNFVRAKKATAYNVNQISAYKAGCGQYKFFPDVQVPANSTGSLFVWNFGDPSSASNTSTLNTPIHTFSANGTYTVTVTLTGSATPIATTQVTVTTSFTPPAIVGTDSVCYSNGTAKSFNSVPLLEGQTVVWSVLSGQGTIPTNNQSEVQINWTQLPGTIQAIITDPSGCSGPVTKTITLLPNVTPTFTQVSAECSGNTVSLPTTSTNDITGVWSLTSSSATAMTYKFTPNANDCASTTTMTVQVLAANDPSCSGSGSNGNCTIDTLTLSSPETNTTTTYKRQKWIKTNTSYSISINKDITMKAGDYVVLESGTHIAPGAKSHIKIEGCSSGAKYAQNPKTKNLEDESVIDTEIGGIVFYPNPTKDIVYISTKSLKINEIMLVSLGGQILSTGHNINSNPYPLDLTKYPTGTYIVIVKTDDGNEIKQKIIKN